MAETPKVAADQPQICEMEAGSHYWCACGLSANGSFCDGSHKTTSITPIKFEISEKSRVAICRCKQTKNPPYCDGSHNSLSS